MDSEKKDFFTLKDIIPDVVTNIENASKKVKEDGIKTGFTDLDNLTLGLHKGELILVSGVPEMGKTALALNIANNLATKQGIPVAYFSFKESKEQLGLRLMAIDSLIELKHLSSGNLTDQEWEMVIDSAEHLSEGKLFINDTAPTNIDSIRQKCMELAKSEKVELIIIDLLLICGSADEIKLTMAYYKKAIASFKELAKELNIPIMLLSPLIHLIDLRPDYRPNIEDIGNSLAIEKNADVIIYLYRDEIFNKETMFPGIVEVIVAKQGHGELGKIDLAFISKYGKYANLTIQKNN